MRLLILPLLATLLLALGCPASSASSKTPDTDTTVRTEGSGEQSAEIVEVPYGENADPANPLDRGWFRYSSTVDGDTIWVTPLQRSLRLLCIDSEETYKVEEDKANSGFALVDWDATVKAAIAADWKQTPMLLKDPAKEAEARKIWNEYAQNLRGDDDRPVKFGSHYGDLAREYATWFFETYAAANGEKPMVRLELDDPARQVDVYDRYLVYVFVKGPDGQEKNFHVELVRMGLSPYFPKYGHSVNYREDFLAAEAEAKAAGRGIWSGSFGHYPDYAERHDWWYERGDQILHYEQTYKATDPRYHQLLNESEYQRLQQQVGKEAIVFGHIASLRGRSDPATIVLEHTDAKPFTIETTNPIAIAVEESGWQGKFVYVRGVIGESGGLLTLKLSKPEDIWLEPDWVAQKFPQAQLKEAADYVSDRTETKPSDPAAALAKPADIEGIPQIGWEEAVQHENQGEYIVSGKVVAAKQAGAVAFLNFDQDFKTTFSVFFPPDAVQAMLAKMPEDFPDAFVGKTVQVRGEIVHFAENGQDKPEIVVEDPAQIWIVEN